LELLKSLIWQKKVIIPDYSSQHLGNKCIHLSVSYGLEHCVQVCTSSHALVLPGSKIPGQDCNTTSVCLMSMLMVIMKVLLENTHFSIAIKQTHLKSRYGGRHANLFKLGCQRKASKSCQPHESALLCLHSPAVGQATSQVYQPFFALQVLGSLILKLET